MIMRTQLISDWKKFNEKLGIVYDIESIADDIIKGLSKKNYFEWKGKFRGKDITIECYLMNLEKETSAKFQKVDKENNIFKISTENLKKSTIIHELKHLDYYLRAGEKEHDYLTHITKALTKVYTHMLKDPEIFYWIIYLTNQNEFESYFNEFYWELKEKFDGKDLSRNEKRDLIDEYLKEEPLVFVFSHYYKRGFDLKSVFKSNREANKFLSKTIQTIKDYKKGKADIDKWDILLTKFTSLFRKFRKDEEIDNSLVKDIEMMINKSIKRNFKKISRLYTLLLD